MAIVYLSNVTAPLGHLIDSYDNMQVHYVPLERQGQFIYTKHKWHIYYGGSHDDENYDEMEINTGVVLVSASVCFLYIANKKHFSFQFFGN